MENEIIYAPDNKSDGELIINKSVKNNLVEISQWTMFFSILGIIFISLLIVGGFFFGAYIMKLSGQEAALPFPGYFLGFVYAFMGAIYLPPVLFLYRFTRHIRKAISTNNGVNLDTAFANLKSHYRYMGILTSIVLVIYVFSALIIGIVAMFYR